MASTASHAGRLQITLLRPFLEQLFVPVLEELLHFHHELVGDRAIDDAMVVADAEVHHGADGDGVVAVLVGDDHWLLDDAAHAHDRDLRLVDDRHAEFGAENARVGDGERAALHLVRLELLAAGTISPQSRATAMPRLIAEW